ncbi:hypothetical protein [Helicobacter pylori]|uniref:hypothetical protein n=1 Tax=Helicobacter pylori TaxID=210 RepID=UPI000EB11667|nr:hypothetical protein [Helicobacter pylori]WQX04734.1 hypothetical protein E5P83_05345 [Helicobacter pylori]
MENSKTNTPTIYFLRKNGKRIEILDYHGLSYETLREKLLECTATRNKMDDLERNKSYKRRRWS